MTVLEARHPAAAKPVSRARVIAIVVLAAVILFINNGFILAGLTAFDSSILADLHLSVTALRLRDTITIATVCVLAPFGGYLIDRLGVKPMLLLGQLVMAVCFLAYGHIQSAGQIYLIHVFLGASQILSGFIICVILVTWITEKRRGFAVGFVLAGSSLGNALAPHINLLTIASRGWRSGLADDAIPPLLMLPLIWALIPAGHRAEKTVETLRPEEIAVGSLGEALRLPNFWFLSMIAFTTVFCVVGVVTNLALYGQRDLGFSPEMAGGLLSILFTAALAAQLLAGLLADYLSPKRVLLGVLGLMLIGCLMLAAGSGSLAPWAALLYGLGWGGNYVLLQFAITSLFRGPAIGRVMGILGVLEAAGGALGPVGCGFFYDRFGDYRAAFATASVIVLPAFIAASCLRFGKQPRRFGAMRADQRHA